MFENLLHPVEVLHNPLEVQPGLDSLRAPPHRFRPMNAEPGIGQVGEFPLALESDPLRFPHVVLAMLPVELPLVEAGGGGRSDGRWDEACKWRSDSHWGPES